jgi:hypothetical protein
MVVQFSPTKIVSSSINFFVCMFLKKVKDNIFDLYNRFNPPVEPVTRRTRHPLYPYSLTVEDGFVFCVIGFEQIGILGPEPGRTRPMLSRERRRTVSLR